MYISVIIYYNLINFRHHFQPMHQTWHQHSRRTRRGTSTPAPAQAAATAPGLGRKLLWSFDVYILYISVYIYYIQ